MVIGAGFSGLYALHRLRDFEGLDVRIIEATNSVGGTWNSNRYPGARCDTESYVYCYSFSEELLDEWHWSERYPQQAELLRYFDHVTNKFDLRRDIVFDTRILAAHYDDTRARWLVRTDSGQSMSAAISSRPWASCPRRPSHRRWPGSPTTRASGITQGSGPTTASISPTSG